MNKVKTDKANWTLIVFCFNPDTYSAHQTKKNRIVVDYETFYIIWSSKKFCNILVTFLFYSSS